MIVLADAEGIEKAAGVIRGGGLVAFPTETVYGLGADATNGLAVARIFEAKGRPSFNPLIVHVPDFQSTLFVKWNGKALSLAQRYWPGPLTLVLPLRKNRSGHLSGLVTAGLDTAAIRIPGHPVALALLRQAGVPIAAPSANISGRVSATEAQHVFDDFGIKIDLIVNGGRTERGLESTIVSFADAQRPTLLRVGAIPSKNIEFYLGERLHTPSSDKIEAPGQLSSHYAPRALVRMNADGANRGELLLAFGPGYSGAALNLSPRADLVEAAINLFDYLRRLDAQASNGIAVTPIPDYGLGEAINDRLRRAAAPN